MNLTFILRGYKMGINVLSLFGGIEAGKVALDRLGIEVDNYYSSEVDEYAISITKFQHPDIIHVGDITKWREWGIDLSSIDLILAGFPCQAWSVAGNQQGDNDPRGALVHDLIDIWKNILDKNIDVRYLFENVKMKKDHMEYVSNLFNVEPILINSSLVSGQNRERYYWTNILGIEQPMDRKIMLKDVVLSDAKNPTVCMHNLYGGFGEKKHRANTEKSPTLRTPAGGGHIPSLLLSEKALSYMDRTVKGGRSHWDFKHHSDTKNDKSSAVVANFFKGVPYNVLKEEECIRHFSAVECERLQTFDDNYTAIGIRNGKEVEMSKTRRLKAIGNSWTVEVISHILKGIS